MRFRAKSGGRADQRCGELLVMSLLVTTFYTCLTRFTKCPRDFSRQRTNVIRWKRIIPQKELLQNELVSPSGVYSPL